MAKKAATGRITGGQVVFGIKKNLGDYNSKGAEVTLTFQIEEGADPTEIVRATGQECMMHVAEMLTGKTQPATAAPKVETIVDTTAADAAKAAAAKTLNAKGTKIDPPPGVTVKKPEKAKEPEAGEDLGGDEEFNEDETVLDVTDEQISAALNQTVARLKPKHGSKASMVVKELIAEFVEPPKKSHDIAQQQRPQFIQKLKDLK